MKNKESLQSNYEPDRLPELSQRFITTWLAKTRLPHLYIHYATTQDSQQKTVLLQEQATSIAQKFHTNIPLQPLTTITFETEVRGKPCFFAVTSLNQPVNRTVKDMIAYTLGFEAPKEITYTRSKQTVTRWYKYFQRMSPTLRELKANPPDFDPIKQLGVVSGIVGPFLHPHAYKNLDHWFYIQNDADPKTPVEIAVSFDTSLLLQKGTLEKLMQAYEEEFAQRKLFTPLFV